MRATFQGHAINVERTPWSVRVSGHRPVSGRSRDPRCKTLSCRLTARYGFTLIEMVTVISLLSVLFTMTGVMIQFLLRSEQTVSQQAVLEMTLLNVSQQFRDDVHAAIKVGTTDDNSAATELELVGPIPQSIRVKYRVEGMTVIRESSKGDQPANREVYRLPECQIQIRRESKGEEQSKSGTGSKFIELSIDRGGLAITPQQQVVHGKRQLTVLAELARDQRILKSLSGPPKKDSAADAEKPGKP